MAAHLLLFCFASTQLPIVSKDELWYMGWIDEAGHSFHAFALLKDCREKPEWTFIRNKNRSGDDKDQQFETGTHSSPSYGFKESFEPDLEQYGASRR